MNSIKKVSVKDFDKKLINSVTKQAENIVKQVQHDSIEKIEKVHFEDNDLAQYYLEKEIIDNWSSKESKTMDEMKNLIYEMQSENVPIGLQLSIMARIVSLPYVKMTDGEGRGWAAAGESQSGPDTVQYNILHDIAVDIRSKDKDIIKNHEDPDYAYGSCAQAVATIIITLFDSKFPVKNPDAQESYLNNTDKFQYIKDVEYGQNWGELKPGDILLSEKIDEHNHVMLFTGEENGKPLFFEAASERDGISMYPIVSERAVNDDFYKRDYHIFRPTVNEENSDILSNNITK